MQRESSRLHVTARAKVNLSLTILGRRQDGYHEIETIYQSIGLADEIDVELTRDGNVEIECSDSAIPVDESNLCHRAVVAMRPYAGDDLGARIRIDKRIPSQAGLGGGSADAAGILRAVDEGRGLRMDRRRLERVAAALGSDVPFMLHGGTALGRGRGEKLTPLEAIKGGWFLVVKPPVSISTAWAYAHYRFGLTKHRARTNLKTVNAVLTRFPTVAMSFRNDLEDVVCPAYPLVSGVLSDLLLERPCFASMSGSGSAVFAVFVSQERAANLAERFSVRGYFTSVVEPAKRAIDIEPYV